MCDNTRKLGEAREEIDAKDTEIMGLYTEMWRKDGEIAKKDAEIANLKRLSDDDDLMIAQERRENEEKDAEIAALKKELAFKEIYNTELKAELNKRKRDDDDCAITGSKTKKQRDEELMKHAIDLSDSDDEEMAPNALQRDWGISDLEQSPYPRNYITYQGKHYDQDGNRCNRTCNECKTFFFSMTFRGVNCIYRCPDCGSPNTTHL